MQRYNDKQPVLIETQSKALNEILNKNKFHYVTPPYDLVAEEIIAYRHEGKSHGRYSKHFLTVKRADQEIEIQVITHRCYLVKMNMYGNPLTSSELRARQKEEQHSKASDLSMIQVKIDQSEQEKLRKILEKNNFRYADNPDVFVDTEQVSYYRREGATQSNCKHYLAVKRGEEDVEVRVVTSAHLKRKRKVIEKSTASDSSKMKTIIDQSQQEKLEIIVKKNNFRYAEAPHDKIKEPVISYQHIGSASGRKSKHYLTVKKGDKEVRVRVITYEAFKKKKPRVNQTYVYEENGQVVPKQLIIHTEVNVSLQLKNYVIDPPNQKKYVLTKQSYNQRVRRANSSKSDQIITLDQSFSNLVTAEPKNKKRRIEELEPQTSNSSVLSNEPSITRNPHSLFAPTQLVKPSKAQVVSWDQAHRDLHSEDVDASETEVETETDSEIESELDMRHRQW